MHFGELPNRVVSLKSQPNRKALARAVLFLAAVNGEDLLESFDIVEKFGKRFFITAHLK